MIEGEHFYSETDINMVLPDGRHVLMLPAFERILLDEARKRGFLKDDVQVGPSEIKSEDSQPEEARTPDVLKTIRRVGRRK